MRVTFLTEDYSLPLRTSKISSLADLLGRMRKTTKAAGIFMEYHIISYHINRLSSSMVAFWVAQDSRWLNG